MSVPHLWLHSTARPSQSGVIEFFTFPSDHTTILVYICIAHTHIHVYLHILIKSWYGLIEWFGLWFTCLHPSWRAPWLFLCCVFLFVSVGGVIKPIPKFFATYSILHGFWSVCQIWWLFMRGSNSAIYWSQKNTNKCSCKQAWWDWACVATAVHAGRQLRHPASANFFDASLCIPNPLSPLGGPSDAADLHWPSMPHVSNSGL